MEANGFTVFRIVKYFVLLVVLLACTGLSWWFFVKREPLTVKELAVANKLNLDVKQLEILKAKPLYKFTESEIDKYLKFLYALEPDPRKRIVHLARKCIGQPYNIYLLGEFPFELYDPDPLYTLKKSDCLVFSEHMYAMSLAWDWRSFFALLQRIRYKDGEISMVTRNHYTIPDWDRNNSWLVEDITDEIGGDLVTSMTVSTNRKKFFAKYGIQWDKPETVVHTNYIPAEAVPKVIGKLQQGDFVNVIRGFDKPAWCGHTGLITISEDGTVNFLHSTPPRVKEQPLLEYMEKSLAANPKRKAKGKPIFYGFKFLRFRDDALAQLKKIDGPDAPKVTGPRGILASMPK